MTDDTSAHPESQEENTPEHDRDAKPWLLMIQHAEKAFDQWNKTCDNLAKEFASIKRLAKSRTDREYQIFYANLEVIKPVIYARAPQPVAVPRFKDRKPVPRKTSEIMERALVTSFDTEKVHETLKKVRDDLALCARGVVWCRYETYDKGGEPKECVRYEWLFRQDFLHEPARVWSEVGWVARGTWLTKEQGEARFGEENWTEIEYEDAPDTDEDYKVVKKARVWELWHKEKNLVVWLHPHASNVLDIAPPHLSLEGFFPCPRPAYGTCEPDSLIPVPDACFYKDQLEEINELTARISLLSESLRLQVFYAKGHEDIGGAIESAVAQVNAKEDRRVFIPLAGLSGFGQNSKITDAIWEMPIDKVAATIKELVALRQQLIGDVYQISGVSDIMRGETDANETATAQNIKAQYGSVRVKDRQGEMIRIADGVLNIGGEIMAENFSPETLMSMSQTEDLPRQADVIQQHIQEAQKQIQELVQKAQQPGPNGAPPQPVDPAQFEQAKQAIIVQHQQAAEQVVTVEKVFGLLRAERMRPFVLQIATDSTIQPDENAEKQARNEFGAAFSQFTAALAPIIQADPAGSADFAGQMLKFMLAPYRAGREMEQAVDDWVERMKEKAKQPPPPSPEQIKAEGEAKKLDADVKSKNAELEDRKAERADKTRQSQADAADRELDRAHKERMADRDITLKDKDIELKNKDLQLKNMEAGTRLLEADAAKETVADKREQRRFETVHKAKSDTEGVRKQALDNDNAELDMEARLEERAARKGGAESKRRTDEMAERAASTILADADARAEQTRAMLDALARLVEGMNRTSDQQAQLSAWLAQQQELLKAPRHKKVVRDKNNRITDIVEVNGADR